MSVYLSSKNTLKNRKPAAEKQLQLNLKDIFSILLKKGTSQEVRHTPDISRTADISHSRYIFHERHPAMHCPPPTQRTRLRPFTEKDKPLIRTLCANPSVMRFFPSPLDDEASDALLARILTHQEQHGFSLWAAEERNSSRFMGVAGLSRVSFTAPFTPCIEIGWRFLPQFWGRGLACEAARSVLCHGFSALNIPEIVAFTTISNLPSQRLMERLGMAHNAEDDFDHPLLPQGHPLRRHVLYRLRPEQFMKQQSKWQNISFPKGKGEFR